MAQRQGIDLAQVPRILGWGHRSASIMFKNKIADSRDKPYVFPHVRNTIEPALARGSWVVSDRFLDSSRVYQGSLGHLDPKFMRALERVTVGDLRPDLTFILDVPAEIGLARARERCGGE